MAPEIAMLDNVTACLILNDGVHSHFSSSQLTEALKRGWHILWAAPLPADPEIIRNWHKMARETGVIVMFSMWSHYAPSTQWLFNHINPPGKIHIHREWPGPQNTPDVWSLYRIFLEEISLCLEWSRSQPVRFEGNLFLPTSRSDNLSQMQQMHIRFGNGTTSSLFLNPYGLENRHSRFITGNKMAAVCQINGQLIKKWIIQGDRQQSPQILHFDYTEPARHLLSHFFRSVLTGVKPIFGIHELNHLADIIERLRSP